jgi:hypothetical protein
VAPAVKNDYATHTDLVARAIGQMSLAIVGKLARASQ